VVVLDAVIDTSGRVTEIDVLRALRFGLTKAAVRAVRTWRFEPACLDGRAVAVRYNLTVRFALKQSPETGAWAAVSLLVP
jgi:protein TonB